MVTNIRATIAWLVVFATSPILLGEEPAKTNHAVAALRVRQIVGHRGSSADRPENTLASTRRAIEAKATAVEVDVRLSKDGRLVLRHDDTLDRTTNGKGLVSDKTLAELKELDAGSWFDTKFAGEKIPTLEEALAVCKGKIDVLLDLKESGEEYAKAVADVVAKHGEEQRTIVGVRSIAQAREFRRLLPKARQIGLIATTDEIESYSAAGVETIRLWPRWLADISLVARVRKTNAGLHLNGTLGTAEEIVPLFDHEPDSLSSDDPAKLVETLSKLAAEGGPPVLAKLEGEIPLAGLRDMVEVARDKWGVPHIYAKNSDDLFFAQGFVAAQDRLFQIDMWRRQGVGELAEVMGPSAALADTFARLIRYRGDMEDEWRSYSADTQAIATAFTRGINAGIDQFGDRPPLEFQVLGYRPKKWKPEDILGRSSGIYMTQNYRNEAQRMKLIDLVGFEKARWLAPLDPPHDYKLHLSPEDAKLFPEKILQGYEALTKSLSFTPSKTESNNWVLSGSRSKSGKPLLASDPHRAIALPSLRYLVHLSAPGWNVIGAGEPGLPGVAIGHNEHIAWGFTIVGADTADIFVEELGEGNNSEYAVGDRFVPAHAYQEEIVVKGQATPTRVTVKHSRHGPILHEDAEHRRAYALKWPGSEPGGAAYLPSLGVARATNRAEFTKALGAWRVPGLNFIYADTEGNIGWVATARFPVRENHAGVIPVPGRSGFEWMSFLPVAEYPQRFNPPEGMVITANHNIIPPGYSRTVGFEFNAPYRYRRLHDLLSANDKWELSELRALQQDSVSLPAQALVKLLRQVGPAPAEAEAGAILANWDGHFSVDAKAGPLYALWLKELQEGLFVRHVPKEHVKILNSLAGVQTAIAALESADPRWFGENAPAERDKLVRESFARAVEKWKQLPPHQQNRWGALHTVTFRHPFGALGPVQAQALNIGPFERPGEGHTPNNTRYDETYQQIHGASYRQLFDLADWDRGLATSAPGQSGQPGSPHYNDLAGGWSRGEYFPLAYSRKKVDEVTRHRLWLVPK